MQALDKQKYIQYCIKNTLQIPVFLQPFWLDAVAENWDVLVEENDHTIFAALPFCIKGNVFTKRIYLPTLSFYQSFIFFDDTLNNIEKNSIANNLFNQLPKSVKSYFKILPQYSTIKIDKYKQENYTTYFISNEKNDSNFFNLLKKSHQRNIKKGEELGFVFCQSNAIAKSFEVMQKTFERQKLKMKITLNELQKIHSILLENKAGNIFDCKDMDGNILASSLVVWDNTTMYYLMSGYNDEFKQKGANTFLLWKLIQLAKEKNIDFNFCGSSKKSIVHFFEGFAAKPQILLILKKYF